MDKRFLVVIYMAILVVAAAVVYYSYISVNQPQPTVFVNFNHTQGTAIGYINNTLKYPILIKTIYCTMPGGRKEEFSSPSNTPIQPGSNSSITLDTAGTSSLPEGCSGWKVSYNIS